MIKNFYRGLNQKTIYHLQVFLNTTSTFYPNMASTYDLSASTSAIPVDGDSPDPSSPSPPSTPQVSWTTFDGDDDNGSQDKSGASQSVNLRTIDPKDLQVVEYNEGKSLAIHGPATRLYVKELKGLKAIFVKWLHKVGSPGWTVSIKHQEGVDEWFDKVKSGEFSVDLDAIEKYHADKASFRAKRNGKTTAISGVPTIPSKGRNNKPAGRFGMQKIVWTIPRPHLGLSCTIQVGDELGNYIVSSITEEKGSVVEVIIHPVDDADSKSKIVPVPTGWQIWGFDRKHTIRFGS